MTTNIPHIHVTKDHVAAAKATTDTDMDVNAFWDALCEALIGDDTDSADAGSDQAGSYGSNVGAAYAGERSKEPQSFE